MTRTDALILRTAAVWTVFIWVTRIRNILSVAFAVAIWQVASRSRRRAGAGKPS
jgi:hypothetical protein